jgi:hypothetical protein
MSKKFFFFVLLGLSAVNSSVFASDKSQSSESSSEASDKSSVSSEESSQNQVESNALPISLEEVPQEVTSERASSRTQEDLAAAPLTPAVQPKTTKRKKKEKKPPVVVVPLGDRQKPVWRLPSKGTLKNLMHENTQINNAKKKPTTRIAE